MFGIVMLFVVGYVYGEIDFDKILVGNLCCCIGYVLIICVVEVVVKVFDIGVLLEIGIFDFVFGFVMLCSFDEFVDWYVVNLDGILIVGGIDVGLWVIKGMCDLGKVVFVGGCSDLKLIEVMDNMIVMGVGVIMFDLLFVLEIYYFSYVVMVKCYVFE